MLTVTLGLLVALVVLATLVRLLEPRFVFRMCGTMFEMPTRVSRLAGAQSVRVRPAAATVQMTAVARV